MLSVSSKVLSLSAEAAVLVRGGRVIYANALAEKMLGADCVGKGLRELFGCEIAEAQAGVFTADAVIAGKRRNLRTARLDDVQAFFVSEIDLAPALVNDAFLYAMRSSMMNLQLSADLVRSRAEQLDDAQLPDLVRTAQRDLFRISRLLENAAAVRGIAAGDLAFSPEAMDLTALCRGVIDSVSLLRGDIRFSFYCEDTVCLRADRVLIEQLLYNLLSNALVHAEGCSQIALSLMTTPTQVILSVSDDGCGIPEDVMGHVFERYRDGFAVSSLARGAGLGLSVVRGIAQLHEGTLMLESRREGGVSARVSLMRTGGTQALSHAGASANDMRKLLTQMSVCLPTEYYDAKYMD